MEGCERMNLSFIPNNYMVCLLQLYNNNYYILPKPNPNLKGPCFLYGIKIKIMETYPD